MTMYLGETIMISVAASEFRDDDVLLTEDDVSGVAVEIFDSALTSVADDDMLYDTDADGNGFWYFMWQTAATATPTLTAGTYKARCTLTDVHGNVSIEWKRIRLARQPVQD